ncbi:MAG: type II secretion system minor pseudopilin GspK [Pseudomonadales bacterium]
MTSRYTPRLRQQGVALITILLVVAIATVLATSMMTDQNIRVHRAINHFDQEQTRQYALGGEELARQILHEDFVEEPGVQHTGQVWASNDLEFEFREGTVELKIEDLQGKLNVNTLASTGDNVQHARTRFITMMRQLGIDEANLMRLEDWLDQDQSARQLGAEDFDYLALAPPYRTGSGIMVDKSEIRLLLDLDQDTYETLAPWVTALPDTATRINVNTAPPVVLQALAADLTLDVAQSMADRRDEQDGFQSVNEFLQMPEMSGVPDEGLGVQSAFFQVNVRAHYRDRFAYLTSIIQRDQASGNMRVIYRNISRKVLRSQVQEQDSG